MPAQSELTPQNLDLLEAYLNNPAAGALSPHQREEAPLTPPPGQTRYSGQFGNVMHAHNGLPVIGPPWSDLVAYDKA
jgi:hypothetical protein